MKKKNIIILIIVLLIILISLFISGKYLQFPFKLHSNIRGTVNKECDYKPKLYYELPGRKIYSYCLDEIKVRSDNEFIELKDYLKNNSIDDFIKLLEFESSFDDGGTTIYRDGGTKKYTKGALTIIKCNKLANLEGKGGNKDIYIGPKNMEFKSNFCMDNNSTIVRTYRIEDIHEYKKQQYENGTPVTYSNSYEAILTNNKNEKAKVILNDIRNIPQKGKTYEFEFMAYSYLESFEDTIENIFSKLYLVEIRETKKEGKNQINEKILLD